MTAITAYGLVPLLFCVPRSSLVQEGLIPKLEGGFLSFFLWGKFCGFELTGVEVADEVYGKLDAKVRDGD